MIRLSIHKLALAVLCLALIGCAAQARESPPPPPAVLPCVGGGWTQAEAIVLREEISEPITSISARLQPFEKWSFDSCVMTEEHEGSSAAFVNLAAYDRHHAKGGNLVQLGVWQRNRDSQPHFVYSENVVTGGIVILEGPRPEAGHSYEFTISAMGSEWRFEIRDESDVLYDFNVPATWTDPVSAWLMFETYDASVVPGKMPAFEGFRLNGAPASPESCHLSHVWYDPETQSFPFDRDVNGITCSVASETFGTSRP